MILPSKFARLSAAAGGLLWAASLLVRTGDSFETELIQKILLLAVFVVVPLAVSLIAQAESEGVLHLAIWIQPLGAVLCFVSFRLNQGIAAGVLVSVWFCTVCLIALAGLIRILRAERRLSLELSISAGMIYLPIGGAWLLASRLGVQPLGFGDTIVLLTAVHFHYAGFAAPILAGLAGRCVRHLQAPIRVTAVAATAIVFGTPIVAAGITLSPKLALLGAFLVTLGLAILAVVVVCWVVRLLNRRIAQALLSVASLSSLVAMVLACLYSYSIVSHTLIVDIPHMAMTHGLLNSFGFALCGLVAWTLELRKEPFLSTVV